MTKLLKWEYLGSYFGYPTCCTDSFKTLAHVGGSPRKLWGTGYVPCLICNELTEDQLIGNINSKRKARLPFPKQESCKETLEHLSEIYGEEVR